MLNRTRDMHVLNRAELAAKVGVAALLTVAPTKPPPAPRNIQSWTEADLEILRTCYGPDGGGSAQAIALMPHRSAGSIATRASEMGLKNPQRNAPANLAWTPERLAKLREAYERGGASAARRAFPELSEHQIRYATKTYGIRYVGDREPETQPAPRPTLIHAVRSGPATKPATAKPTQVGSPVTRGDREHIRRRMQFTIASLSAELKIPASTVAAAIGELSAKKFEADAVGRLSVSPDDANRFSSEGCAVS